MAVELARIESDSGYKLRVARGSPEADVLHREIDRERVRELVLHAFEEGDLPFAAGGFFPEPVYVRRDLTYPVAVAGADVERAGWIVGRGRGGAGPGERNACAVMAGI